MSAESFEFTGDFLKEAQRNIAKYPQGRQQSAVLALLFLAQEQRHDQGHYCDEAVMRTISEMLDMPYIRVMEVASFFTQINLEPVGEFHIQLCGTTPCMLRGAEDIKSAIETKLGIHAGQTTQDKKFTLTEVECLGACCNAPMVQINDDYFEDLTPDIMTGLIEKLSKGEAVTPGPQNGRSGSEPEGGPQTLQTGPAPQIRS
jgi:NADH-quinone oxidoreductase E subunit